WSPERGVASDVPQRSDTSGPLGEHGGWTAEFCGRLRRPSARLAEYGVPLSLVHTVNVLYGFAFGMVTSLLSGIYPA
ncbi:MAG: hypothetical protein LUO93_06360, partial [Methanomicrobiales archaeon]|nr:hypothetical protein [Methanomicrobiales archaeon]